ncbi:probable tyrosine-protein phosphatase F54C8.4 isoform X2 [Anneissia japonica]|uniref:probable tyrosine-protein phosphatase F54C8.4 isoform X2 n=1 Tax=Anneissia japonica TaxID=1529436 RepID=UPI001425A59F|nr:probable tyrosine-protein phosphatase F54C8.4 isoform X2 [Anneissia japonica]
MVKGKNTVPDRWHNYKPLNKVIDGTRFMPIKVPLKKQICAGMTDEQRFMPADLLKILDDKNLKLGLIIDLTFTTRYYNPDEFTSNGISYEKVATAGQQIPTNEVVKRFSKIVKDFEDANKGNEFLIAVHCTHGVNRSGYLMCRYMIENLSFSPDDAIKVFKEARGYGIERDHYLASLRGLSSTIHFEASEETREEQCKRTRRQISPDSCYETDAKRHCKGLDRHNDRQTDRCKRWRETYDDEWTERQNDDWTGRYNDRWTDRHNDRRTDRHNNRQTDRHWRKTGRQPDRSIDGHAYTTCKNPNHSTRTFHIPEYTTYQQRDIRYNHYPPQKPYSSEYFPRNVSSRDYPRDNYTDTYESENCVEFFRHHKYPENQGRSHRRNWQIPENRGPRKRTNNDRW